MTDWVNPYLLIVYPKFNVHVRRLFPALKLPLRDYLNNIPGVAGEVNQSQRDVVYRRAALTRGFFCLLLAFAGDSI